MATCLPLFLRYVTTLVIKRINANLPAQVLALDMWQRPLFSALGRSNLASRVTGGLAMFLILVHVSLFMICRDIQLLWLLECCSPQLEKHEINEDFFYLCTFCLRARQTYPLSASRLRYYFCWLSLKKMFVVPTNFLKPPNPPPHMLGRSWHFVLCFISAPNLWRLQFGWTGRWFLWRTWLSKAASWICNDGVLTAVGGMLS